MIKISLLLSIVLMFSCKLRNESSELNAPVPKKKDNSREIIGFFDEVSGVYVAEASGSVEGLPTLCKEDYLKFYLPSEDELTHAIKNGNSDIDPEDLKKSVERSRQQLEVFLSANGTFKDRNFLISEKIFAQKESVQRVIVSPISKKIFDGEYDFQRNFAIVKEFDFSTKNSLVCRTYKKVSNKKLNAEEAEKFLEPPFEEPMTETRSFSKKLEK